MTKKRERWTDGLEELLNDIEEQLGKITPWHWSYGGGEKLMVSAIEHLDRRSDYVRIATLDEGQGWAKEQGHNVVLIGSAPVWLCELCKRLRQAEAENRNLRRRAMKAANRKKQLRHLNRRIYDLLSGRS